MGRISEERVLRLERQAMNLHERLSALEADVVDAPAPEPATPSPEAPTAVAAAWRACAPSPLAAAAPSAPAIPAPAPPAVDAPATRRQGLDLEDLLGGRVLAWTGGVAVLAGIAFLLAIAVSRGWIGPGARTLLAGALSLALIGAGAWLYDRRARTDAALATLSAGIAGLFCTVAVGGPVYGVLPTAAALALAFATGMLATAFAVRWESRGIGALGIVGALLAPVLAGAPSTATTLALLWLAAASGAAVLVAQRWNWLAVAVFAIPALQWLWWLADGDPSAAAIVLALCAFGALNVAAAIGFELRVPAARLRAASALLLTANAMTLALAGWFALDGAGATTLGRLWIGALAVTHLAVGLMTRSTRVNRDIRLLALVLGVVLGDVTAGLMLDGAVLASAFAVTTAGLGALACRRLADPTARDAGRDATLLGLGLGGHLLLTSMQALTQMPPEAVSGGDAIAVGGYAAIAMTACAAFAAGRFVDDVRPQWRLGLDVVAMAGAAYLTTAAMDGPVLAAAFAAEAAALGAIAARERDAVAGWGGGAYLALAVGHALAFEAPPEALVAGLSDVPGAALALSAGGTAALLGARQLGRARRDGAPRAGDDARALMAHLHAALGAAGAVVLLYLASTSLVTGFQPGSGAATAGLLDLGVRELGQLLLSGLWAITGVAALVIGLRRDERALRLGSLALLMVTVGKVFLYDLAALTSLYRVGSFIGLGLLLLVAAGIWQRMRPRPLADLREVPEAVR
ncbi:MAG: DUF2339 domain-containing protein [Solirubrobacteraceae bacterium]